MRCLLPLGYRRQRSFPDLGLSTGYDPVSALYQSAVLPLNEESALVPAASIRTRISPGTNRRLYQLSYTGLGADSPDRTGGLRTRGWPASTKRGSASSFVSAHDLVQNRIPPGSSPGPTFSRSCTTSTALFQLSYASQNQNVHAGNQSAQAKAAYRSRRARGARGAPCTSKTVLPFRAETGDGLRMWSGVYPGGRLGLCLSGRGSGPYRLAMSAALFGLPNRLEACRVGARGQPIARPITWPGGG